MPTECVKALSAKLALTRLCVVQSATPAAAIWETKSSMDPAAAL